MPDELRGSYTPRGQWVNEREYRLILDEFNPDRPGRPPGEDRREYIVTMVPVSVAGAPVGTTPRKGKLWRAK